MSVHDETWDKCPKCNQTIKSWHGGYHDSGYCINFTFEEYSNIQFFLKEKTPILKNLNQKEVEYRGSPAERVYTDTLIHQNKILRAALEGKRVVCRPLNQPYWPLKEIPKNHNFDFDKNTYKIEEKKHKPTIAYFVPTSTKQWEGSFGQDEESAKGYWDFKGVSKLSFYEVNKFILLDDKVKKALDSANISYD